MSIRTVRCLFSLALALAAGPALAAPAQQIDGQGILHRVEAVWAGKPAMPVLRHTMVRPDGTTVTLLVPGTIDLFVDTDPALAVDPARGSLVLAWSRNTGGGSSVYVSRYSGSGWSSPLLALHDASGDEIEPQIQITPSLVHVVAHSGNAYQRICLDPESLHPVFGPEPLATERPAITPGVDAPTATPIGSQNFFASAVLRPAETDPGRVVIWGVRDEPVPIDYVEALALPSDPADGNQALADPIEGRLMLTVTSATRMWYTLFEDGEWRSFASLSLDETTTVSELRTLLADMIRRSN